MISRLFVSFALCSGLAACAHRQIEMTEVFHLCALDPLEWVAIAPPENASALLAAASPTPPPESRRRKFSLYWFSKGEERLLVCRIGAAESLPGCDMHRWSYTKRDRSWVLDELQQLAVCG